MKSLTLDENGVLSLTVHDAKDFTVSYEPINRFLHLYFGPEIGIGLFELDAQAVEQLRDRLNEILESLQTESTS